MSGVWDNSQASGTPLLVLLALADMADDDGECWPAIKTIRQKCRLKDDRHVKRVIHEELERRLGEVVVLVSGGKSSAKGGVRSNRYRITVHLPADATVVHQPPSGDDSGSPTTHDSGSPTTQTVVEQPPESSLTRQGESSLVPASPKSPRRRASQVPEDFTVTHEMRVWCEAQGIRSDPMTETEKFIDHHRSKGSTFVDHTGAWRNWMRNADKWSKSSASDGGRSKSMQAIDAVWTDFHGNQVGG